MQDTTAFMIRHICQHHLHLEDPEFCKKFQELLGLEEEEMDAIRTFQGDVACHALERAITNYHYHGGR